MADAQEMHEQNRRSWNHATRAHNSHKGDQAAFFREGGSTLFPEELELLGEVRGQRVVHLQCNAGQDSLSIAQLGAVVTGVDISDEAVDFAAGLSRDSGIAADFVRADVYDWFRDAEPERWDVVFSSYGAKSWLSDLGAWGRGVARVLRPGGRFVTVEFHPLLAAVSREWSLTYPYFGGVPKRWEEGIGDYVADSGDGLALSAYAPGIEAFVNPEPIYEFAWGLADVVTALVDAGLVLEALREYPFANGWRAASEMRIEGRRAYPPERVSTIPLMYGIAARKPY